MIEVKARTQKSSVTATGTDCGPFETIIKSSRAAHWAMASPRDPPKRESSKLSLNN